MKYDPDGKRKDKRDKCNSLLIKIPSVIHAILYLKAIIVTIMATIVFTLLLAGCGSQSGTGLPGSSLPSTDTSNPNPSSSTKNDVSTTRKKVQTETNTSISKQSKPNPKKTAMEDRMIVESKAFSDGGRIPTEYANTGIPGGKNISIPVEWEGIDNKNPEVKSYALTIIDRSAHDWVHWIVLDIPASVTGLEKGASGKSMPNGAREIMNTFGVKGYGGPQPPAGSGDHIYEVTVYALNVSNIDLDGQPSYKEFLQVINGKVVDQAKISGVLSR